MVDRYEITILNFVISLLVDLYFKRLIKSFSIYLRCTLFKHYVIELYFFKYCSIFLWRKLEITLCIPLFSHPEPPYAAFIPEKSSASNGDSDVVTGSTVV